MTFKSKMIALLAVVLLPVWQVLAGASYWYAKMTVSPTSSAAGMVYASDNQNPSALDETTITYSDSNDQGGNAIDSSGGSVTIYGYAMPKFGYRFNGWSKTAGNTDLGTTRVQAFTGNVASRKSLINANTGQDNANNWGTYYASFSAVTVKTITLCVGDSVQLKFHNGTSAVWITRLNEAFTTGTSAVDGSHVSVTRSADGNAMDFGVTVTANSVTGDAEANFDKLAVIDNNNNTYCYQFKVVAARTVQEWQDLSFTVDSTASKTWATPTSGNTSVATVTMTSPASGTAAATATVNVHGVATATSPVSLTISNYDANDSANAAVGVIYTCKITVTEAPKFLHYAKMTAAVGGSGGKVYVSTDSLENTVSYTTLTTEATASVNDKHASAAVGNFYLYAFPEFGYKCTGWGKGSTDAATTLNYAHNASPLTITSSATTAASAPTENYYAHFAADSSRVKDIYLAVGDTVQLYFHNTAYAPWSARVNSTFLTGVSAQSSSYASYTRSQANTAATQDFNVLVTATTVSGDNVDQLTVQDYQGNVYHYRIHVTAARNIYKDMTANVTVNSFLSGVWGVSAMSDSATLSGTVPLQDESTSTTVTLSAHKVTDTGATVTVSDYATSGATGPYGATYTLKATVTDPPKVTYYAQVATEVVGGSSSGLGVGWAYASRNRKENSDVYQTTRSTSEKGSTTVLQDGDTGSAEVDGFYLFAFPNLGYKFVGWSETENGPIVHTEAYAARDQSVVVTASSTEESNPTVKTYYAHFERDDSRVRDIYLCVGDSVRLSFYNELECNWSLQVVYTNNNSDAVVNLDDVEVHAGGYANYTRSASTDPAAASQEFSMFVEATRRSGNDYDQLTIEDASGNVYHYRVHVSDARVFEAGETVAFSANAFRSGVWGKANDDTSIVTATVTPMSSATDSATVTVTGVNKGKTSFKVSNYQSPTSGMTAGPLGAEYTFSMDVIRAWPVEFCQGDEVIIYYHNPVPKNWYLLINGTRFEQNVEGSGTQMKVTLTATNPDSDTEILGVATTVGDGTSSDLVVVTDGENFYAYRMSVKPRRVIGIGETASMTCTTVATSPWKNYVSADAARYVDTTFDNNVNEGHSATITATGKKPGKNVVLKVYNREDTGEVNAMGAKYTLVLDVVGANTRKAYMSKGTSVTWGEYNSEATGSTTYTLTPSAQNGITAAIASNTATTVFTTLTVPESATFGQTALFTVKDNNAADVVKYDIMAYGVMSMAVDQVAPGCLNGSEVPWVVWASNPDKLSIEPVVYNKLNSGRVEAKHPGDFWLWATNASDKVDWYVIRAQVYDESSRVISMAKGATTSLTISAETGLAEVWSLTPSCEHLTASIDNTTTAADHVQLSITAGTVEGTHKLLVKNAFHQETITVYVGAESGQEIIIGEKLTLSVGNHLTLPAECTTSADWTAFVTESGVGKYTVTASGSAGAGATLTGVSPGTGQVVVKTATKIYVYDVEVERYDGTLDPIMVGVGYTVVTNLTSINSALAGATLVTASDSMIATAVLVGDTLTVKGVQDGETNIQLATDDYLYTLTIKSHERKIHKAITLYVGADGTATSYSYTFDSVVSITNHIPDRLIVTQEGRTVTITPKPGSDGTGQVDVECFVDGHTESSTLMYGVTIVQEKNNLMVRNYDEGYVAYRDADVVRELNGDLVFIFTNVDAVGTLHIPEGYSARLDILAVGGGGGGGSVATGFGRGGGGGGAGGYTVITNKKMSAGTFCVQVGKPGLGLSNDFGGMVSLRGSQGGDSVITNSFGYTVAIANGGGGGGAPSAANFSGVEGGSGGGGAWITTNGVDGTVWVAGRGGLGILGQGCDGGTPNQNDCGGGGGGASGNGGSGMTRGPGVYSSISGENTLYSLGGLGGDCKVATQALSGQGPGFGGDGGNGGPGGDGGAGTVIVRFHKLYQNILVDIPTTNNIITARFQWEDGTNYTPIAYIGRSFRSTSNAHPYNWEDVFESVSGTTNVVCQLGGEGNTNKVGVGYYNFYLRLKDGFAWDDGSEYGSTERLRYRWVICENWSDIDADLSVNKTVWWSDKSNATVRVSSVASPEMAGGGIPKVLFLGTLCRSHSLAVSTVVASLNAVAERADIDYYLYSNNSLTKSGKMYMGDTIDSIGISSLEYSQHSSLRAFYERLYQDLVVNGNTNKYDYIVMEFDGSRIAKYYAYRNDNNASLIEKYDHEYEVAQALVPFYASDSVIWIVDNGDEKSGSVQYPVDEPFGHTSAAWTQNSGHSDLNEYWRPNTYLYSSGHLKMTDTQYQGLIGIFDPKHYLAGDSVTAAQLSTTNVTYAPRGNNGVAGTSSVYYGNDRNELQAHYKNVNEVTNLLGTAIKVKPFNLQYRDKIVQPSEGLTIEDVYIKVCTVMDGSSFSTNDNDWVTLMHWNKSTNTYVYDDKNHSTGIKGASMEVNIVSNLVTACISNLDFKVGVRYDTHVLDADGIFQTSDGANYNESTGQYEKNPNEGAAFLSLVNDLGVAIGVEDDAETQVPWRYTAYTVSGAAQNGSVFVQGTQYASLACPEGRDATVYYRGNGGYRLAALKVDGNDVQVGTGYDNSYTFANLSGDHHVQAVYTAYYGTVTPISTTNQYDGAAHVPRVKLEGWDATYATETRYALTPEGPYYNAAEFAQQYSSDRTVTCVGDHTVYCRVYALQPGYGATLDESGWVWVDTRVVEQATVTITQKPLFITANSFKLNASEAPKEPPLNQWRGVTVEGLVAGDTVNTNDTYLTWYCPDYSYEIGQYRLDPQLVPGRTKTDIAGDNYAVYFRPGVLSVRKAPMIIGGISQAGFLDPEPANAHTGVDRVEKIYDGVATNLVIRIDDPTGEELENITIKYSVDEGQTWTTTLPTRLHVGTSKVWYAVEYGADQEASLYFWVTNYNYVVVNPRPITFTADSATQVYNAQPLTANRYEITAGSLATGDQVSAITVSGSQTAVGTSANSISGAHIQAGDDDRTGDYTITYVNGTLTVTPGAIVIGDQDNHQTYTPGKYVPYGETGVKDVEKVYDGEGTNIVVNVITPGSGYTVRYTTDALNGENIVWHDDLSFTEVGTYAVHFLVEAENYAPVTNTAKVVITPRPLVVTAQNAMVRAGETPNYTYVVRYQDTGEVVPQSVLEQLTINIGSPAYVAALADSSASNIGDFPIVPSGEALQGNYSLTFENGTLTSHNKLNIPYTATGSTTTYDGNGHTISVTVTDSEVPTPVITYSLTPDDPNSWSTTPPQITNATPGTQVYFKITPTGTNADNYLVAEGSAMVQIDPRPATVTVGNFQKLRLDPEPAYTATVSGLLAGDEGTTFTYTFSRDADETIGVKTVNAVGAAVQGNYTLTYVPGTLTIIEWTYPVGPNEERIPIDVEWISGHGGDEVVTSYANASNYVFSVGTENGVTNWVNYVLGLDPNNASSVVYVDIEPNLDDVIKPTLVARGAKVIATPLGSLQSVKFRLLKANTPKGPYAPWGEDTINGRFPQTDIEAKYYRVQTVFEFTPTP